MAGQGTFSSGFMLVYRKESRIFAKTIAPWKNWDASIANNWEL